MRDGRRTVGGVVRSLRLYYGDRARRALMRELYAGFVKGGDLVFDVGAHVGDRVACFRSLGARVVAVEPQPALVRILQILYARDEGVIIEPVAVGRREGRAVMKVNVSNPTISSLSDAFIAAAAEAPGWSSERWSHDIAVPVASLDGLIARHGVPTLIKLDVEGFEREALAGLSSAPPALSFEFTLIQRALAFDCIRRCLALGLTRFNAALGESQKLVHPEWVGDDTIAAWLAALPAEANSGDIYAAMA
jgi:FkbM family methyltransferase